jgi:prevent-host-death family protein
MAIEPTIDDYAVSRRMTITTARDQFTHLPEEFASGDITSVAVTRRGTPVMAILPWEVYESVMETLEILADRELTATLRECAEEIRSGPTYTADEVRRRLGLAS